MLPYGSQVQESIGLATSAADDAVNLQRLFQGLDRPWEVAYVLPYSP